MLHCPLRQDRDSLKAARQGAKCTETTSFKECDRIFVPSLLMRRQSGVAEGGAAEEADQWQGDEKRWRKENRKR